MIEKMKKLSLLILHSSRDKFLSGLQDIGVVHLETNNSAQNDEIIEINERINELKKTERLLNTLTPKRKIKKESQYNGNIKILIEKIKEDDETLISLKSSLENLEKEIQTLTPWGNFNPEDFAKLEEIGIKIKFYTIQKAKFQKMEKENLAFEIISQAGSSIYFVTFSRENEKTEDLGITETKIPLKSLASLHKEKTKIENEITSQEKKLTDYVKYINIIKDEIANYSDKLSYNIASASLNEEADGKILVITGWFPKRLLKKVNAFLENENVAYLVDDPSEEDNVPILLKNGPFARLFEPITKMNSLPLYTELDPTPFFAPFFAMFFGLCLGDVGYGLIIVGLVLPLLFVKKFKKIRPMLLMGLVLGIATVLGGLVLDTLFGQGTISYLTKNNIIPPEIAKHLYLKELDSAMAFAIFIGIVQVVVGNFVQILNRIKIYGFQGIFKPLGTVCLLMFGVVWQVKEKFIIIGPFISSLPNKGTIMIALFSLGVFFILFFGEVDKKIYVRPGLGLWALYNTLTGILGDVLSYIRLFALGLAGGLLGKSFNDIAFMLRDAVPIPYLNLVAMAAIMIFGHSLNFGLAALSAFVHPLRLILLEFYNNVNFTGGGKAYSPFKKSI